MIVVAGGTGKLGTSLVQRLVDRRLSVRVLTREPARASHLAHLQVEVVQADVRDRDGLSGALAGADTVVSAIHGFAGPGRVSPASVDRSGNVNLIDAAVKTGASFILMSIVGAGPASPMELFRAKHEAEQHLRQSGLAWTIVRATALMETWAMIVGDPLHVKGKTMIFGRGDNPINFVSTADVAALLERAVVDGTLRGQVIELGGPENLTFNQLAAMIQRVVGRPGSVGHVPRLMLRTMAVVMKPFNPMLARQAKAAVVMDTRDMTFDAAPTRRAFPDLPTTDVKTALEKYFDVGPRKAT